MSSVNILDASAVLAYLNEERGEDVVEAALDAADSWITSVNYCEVLSKLCDKGMSEQEASKALDEVGLTVVDFDRELAVRAAALRPRTKGIGASLGDRACFALAERCISTQLAAVVYTADQAWTSIRWPFKVIVIRTGRSA